MALMNKFDAIVIGAGVVGLAIAARLSAQYSRVLVIDKNASFGEETSSRNSEVIHAGLYYPKSSYKANFCLDGKEKLYRYCIDRKIPHHRIGKYLIANGAEDEAALENIVSLSKDNGINDLVWTSKQQLKNAEPEVSATAAVFSPSTGIIDVHSYMQSLLAEVEQHGGLFVANTEFISATRDRGNFSVQLLSVDESITITTTYLINSAGLSSVAVANKIEPMEKSLIPTLYYCRGHYFSYGGKSPFNHLIYPVPERHGLGIHATLDLGGQLKFGPDTEYIDNIFYDVSTSLTDTFYHAIQQYFPNVSREKLTPAYSGIRPKLTNAMGSAQDFNIQMEEDHGVSGLVNLFGIESPGLTASLAIADYIAHHLVFD